MTLGCSVAKKYVGFYIKYIKDYLTVLIKTSHVDRMHDFESHHLLNLIFFKIASDSSVASLIMNDPRVCTFFRTFHNMLSYCSAVYR